MFCWHIVEGSLLFCDSSVPLRRYEVQDLRVIEYLPQMVVLSETYFQVWQLQGQDQAAAKAPSKQ